MTTNEILKLIDRNIEIETTDHNGIKEIRLIHIDKVQINDDPSCPCRLSGVTILKGEIMEDKDK